MTAPDAPVGLTLDAGWELGVRRTLPVPFEECWAVLIDEWLPRWLMVDAVPQMVGAPLRQGLRSVGRVTGCHVGTRVRVRWDQPEAADETVFQVTLLPAATGTTIALHQERLSSAEERERLLAHWTRALERLATELRDEAAQQASSEPAS